MSVDNNPIHTDLPKALLLTGEGLNHLYGQRLDEFRKAVGELGLKLTVLTDLNPELLPGGEDEPTPVPATREDMMTFATANGYSRQWAGRAWNLTWLKIVSFDQVRFADLPLRC